MSWADIKERYESGEMPASQSTEDMVARRILHALGLTNSEKLVKAERESGAAELRKDDTTLYERANEIAMRLSDRYRKLIRIMDVASSREAEDAVVELYSTPSLSHLSRCAVAYRVKGNQDVRVLACLGSTPVLVTYKMPVPCVLRKTRDDAMYLIECDAQDYFIKMFKEF